MQERDVYLKLYALEQEDFFICHLVGFIAEAGAVFKDTFGRIR